MIVCNSTDMLKRVVTIEDLIISARRRIGLSERANASLYKVALLSYLGQSFKGIINNYTCSLKEIYH